MPAHFDSVFTPGARSADAASRSKFQKALSGCLVLRVERYELKSVLDAQGRPVLAPKKDAEGRPVLGPDGQRVLVEQMEAVGVYGTTCCTGKKIYMRLSTEEELKAIEATFTADYTGEITYMETSYGTKLMVFRETGDDYDFIDFLAYYNGYSIEFIVTPHYVEGEMEGKALTDEDVNRAIQFLSDLDFVPAA